jgi:hypothetical protein
MSEERAPRLERILERTARKVSGGGLHPLELLERVEAACRGAVRDGVAPNVLEVALSPRDYASLRPALRAIMDEAHAVLDGAERAHGWSRLGERNVSFRADAGVADGAPAVATRFSDLRSTGRQPKTGATSRIRRHRGMSLVVDGVRVPLTHTPFVIGRGPASDLVIASLAVSRRHAVIELVGGRLVMRDLNSRNGLNVAGQSLAEAELLPGVPIVLGEVEIVLERET